MALGYLGILLFALILISIILQLALYKIKDYRSNTIYIFNAIFAFILSYLNFTSQPTNFTGLRILSLIWAGFGVVGLVAKIKYTNSYKAARYFLSIAVIGGMIQLLI